MHEMTAQNLEKAFAGESMAQMRYLIFADNAEQQGFANLARLFRAIAYAERVHATNHFFTLGNSKQPESNLDTALSGENFEVEEMYPAYEAVAELQGEKEALKTIKNALATEKIHSQLYEKAKKNVSAGKDIDIDGIYICSVCGYTGVGTPPDKCPLCGAPVEKFKKF